MAKTRVLIVFYSFTQQTKLLLNKFAAGLESEGVEIVMERLAPQKPYNFPFKSDFALFKAMVKTFFMVRLTVKPISEKCFEEYDCVVLAGPTWSYNISGPILDFLDRYGEDVCNGRRVVPFISCRSYWRIHYLEIKRFLMRCGAKVDPVVVFTHPTKEPFRFIGLVLQLRGKMVRKEGSWFRKHYPGYGHNEAQGLLAREKGVQLAKDLRGSG